MPGRDAYLDGLLGSEYHWPFGRPLAAPRSSVTTNGKTRADDQTQMPTNLPTRFHGRGTLILTCNFCQPMSAVGGRAVDREPAFVLGQGSVFSTPSPGSGLTPTLNGRLAY